MRDIDSKTYFIIMWIVRFGVRFLDFRISKIHACVVAKFWSKSFVESRFYNYFICITLFALVFISLVLLSIHKGI